MKICEGSDMCNW